MIGGGRRQLAARLLGRHERGRADAVLVIDRFGQEREAEVGEERVAGGVDEDVRRLDVAVDDAVGVRVRQRRGDLQRHVHGGGRIDRRLQAAREVGAVDVRGREPVLADVEERDDVRMAEPADGAPLAIEGLATRSRDFTFARNIFTAASVSVGVMAAEPDLAHRARAEAAHEPIIADEARLVSTGPCHRRRLPSARGACERPMKPASVTIVST